MMKRLIVALALVAWGSFVLLMALGTLLTGGPADLWRLLDPARARDPLAALVNLSLAVLALVVWGFVALSRFGFTRADRD